MSPALLASTKSPGRGRLGLSLSKRPGARNGSGSLPPALLASTKSPGRGRLGLSLSKRPGARSGSGSLPPAFLRLQEAGRGRLGLSLSERPGARSGSGSLPPLFLRLQKAGARAAWAVPFRETRGAKWERQLAARACERMRECVVRFTKLKNKNMGSIHNRKCKNVFLPVFFMKKETI